MKPFIVVHIVPTGIMASVGGFVGDATPYTNLIASISDTVIINPNVVNGVLLNLAKENVLYVEGFHLDRFFLGETTLRPIHSNKIGVILDRPSEELRNFAINTINAIKSNKGIGVTKVVETKEPVNGIVETNKSGAFVGKIPKPEIFLKEAEKLVKGGAEAIAIATQIKVKEKQLNSYFRGKAPNPYGGLEAIISHLISKEFGIQSAHAPLTLPDKKLFERGVVDERAAAEAIGTAYLGSVLQGLHKAPKPIPKKDSRKEDISLEDLSALVVPFSCLGGIPMLACEKNGIPIIAVKENNTILDVTAQKLKLKNVKIARNYLEAVGLLVSIKEGIA